MAISCGTDITSVERIKSSIEELGDNFKKRIYTDEEISYCESKRMSKYQSYAARFAAKEALYKALAPASMNEITWQDAEVVNDSTGKPRLKFSGKVKELLNEKNICDEDVDISLSHDGLYAIATVVIDKK